MQGLVRQSFMLAALAVVGAAGCQSMQSLRNVSIFSTAQEVELGQQVSAQVEAQNKLITDPAVAGYVARIGERVAAKAPRQDVQYTFKVIDNPKEVNAFAVPGGNVYVYSGLLTRMKSEAELAAVLGHETAHIADSHSMAALTRQAGFDLILRVALGQNAPGWESTLGNLVGNVAFLQFSKEDEKQADRDGLNYMVQAGYDPQGMVGLLTMFTTLSETDPSAIQIFLSSHPAPKERIGIVKDLILKENLAGGVDNPNEYQAAIKGLAK